MPGTVKKLPCTAVVTGSLFGLRERGKYAIYGGMLSGFALLTLVTWPRVRMRPPALPLR